MEKLKGNVRLYACGGAGTNIVKMFEEFRNEEEPGRARLEAVYVDTSRSNLSAAIPEDAIYLFDNKDGSGGVRKDNHKPIAERAKEILHQHRPLDINIVVSSASGGSGSVIAPVLVSELLADGQQVVVIMIGATDTKLFIKNTINTLKSYEGISNKHGVPVVAAYLENSAEFPRAQVDQAAFRLISSLSYVYSRENAELDSRDLFNFVNFHRATDFKPQLAGLSMFWGHIPEEATHDVISVATVAAIGADHSITFTPDYQCLGYMPEGISREISELKAIHLTTNSAKFGHVFKDLDSKLDNLDKASKARIAPTRLIGDDDETTDHGLVL